MVRLFDGVELLHRRFPAVFQQAKVDPAVRAFSNKSVSAEAPCSFLQIFQGNERYSDRLPSDTGPVIVIGRGLGPARSIVNNCIANRSRVQVPFTE
jgi:phosphatidylserine decarboxylase